MRVHGISSIILISTVKFKYNISICNMGREGLYSERDRSEQCDKRTSPISSKNSFRLTISFICFIFIGVNYLIQFKFFVYFFCWRQIACNYLCLSFHHKIIFKLNVCATTKSYNLILKMPTHIVRITSLYFTINFVYSVCAWVEKRRL